MASFIVVELDPGGKGGGAFSVAGEDAAVGPFGGEGSVQSLDFAVLPGAVWLDELLPDAVRCADLAQRPAVGPGVIGDQSFDPGDAVRGEVGDRPLEERRAARSFLVVEGLAVGQAGVVIDQGVDAVVADLGMPVALDGPAGAAVSAPAAPPGILPSFFTSMCTSSPGRSRS